MKFTIELKGITLPEDVQEEISRDLNRLVMKKLGEIDLATKAPPSSHRFLVDLINGGWIAGLTKEFGLPFTTLAGKNSGINLKDIRGMVLQNGANIAQ